MLHYYKNLIFCIALLMASLQAGAQIRHVQGINAIDAGVGISKYGTAYTAGYTQYFSRKVYGKAMLNHEIAKHPDDDFQVKRMFLDIAGFYTLADWNEIMFFNIGLGVSTSIEGFHQIESPPVDNTFKIGAIAGFEVETFISDRWVWLLGGNYRYMTKEAFGNTRYYLTTGIRFNL